MTAVDQDGYPRVCHVCGAPVVKSKVQGGLWFRKDHPSGVVTAGHMRCTMAAVTAVRQTG